MKQLSVVGRDVNTMHIILSDGTRLHPLDWMDIEDEWYRRQHELHRQWQIWRTINLMEYDTVLPENPPLNHS